MDPVMEDDIKEEFTNEDREIIMSNKDNGEENSDLYADDDDARPTGVISYTFTNISQYKDLVIVI